MVSFVLDHPTRNAPMAEKKKKYRSARLEDEIVRQATVIVEAEKMDAMENGPPVHSSVGDLLSDLLRDPVAERFRTALKKLSKKAQ